MRQKKNLTPFSPERKQRKVKYNKKNIEFCAKNLRQKCKIFWIFHLQWKINFVQ